VLDAGCGAGYGSRLLLDAGAAEVLAVDISPEAIRQAEEQFGGSGEGKLNYLVDDCQTLEKVAGRWDVICCFESIEHLERPERFLRRAAELLAADGVLLISTPDRAWTPPFVEGRPRNRFHHFEWFRDEFQALLTPCFGRVEMMVQVESAGVVARRDAVEALRQGLMWSNPLTILLWRKWPHRHRGNRGWRKLRGLAAPTVADYPIVPLGVAPVYGTSACHFAVCREPRVA
jgi:SAM-dependent methyltransferase